MEHKFNALASHTPGVRAYSQERWPSFADCAPSGRTRLDALACWMQDIAYADVADAGLARAAVWVVRRTRIRVNRFPRFGERVELTTFCSGFGRMWAERRTNIARVDEGPREGQIRWEAADRRGGSDGDEVGARAGGDDPREDEAHPGQADVPDVEGVTLWVHLDPADWQPMPLTPQELEVYGGAGALTRRVSARLRHPTGGEDADGAQPWRFRATECDVADHVNNAAYWQPLEEELLAGPDPEHIDVEVEYRAPAQAGVKNIVREDEWLWIVGQDGELHASIAIALGHGS